MLFMVECYTRLEQLLSLEKLMYGFVHHLLGSGVNQIVINF